MQSLSDIKAILASRGLAPKKSLGQNFLIDQNLVRKLADASGVGPGSVVLEVGPGTGVLTEELLERGTRVVACELDNGLAAWLGEREAELGAERLRVIHDDCLSGPGKTLSPDAAGALADFGVFPDRLRLPEPGGTRARKGTAFALVANLPYGVGTPLLLSLLVHWPTCATLAVTIQREVAQRLAALPGSKAYGMLSVVAQALATIKPVATLPPECFWPRPDVTSAMVVLERRPTPRTADALDLTEFAKSLFMARRKQLGAILGRNFPFPSGVVATARPEELDADSMETLRLLAARRAQTPP